MLSAIAARKAAQAALQELDPPDNTPTASPQTVEDIASPVIKPLSKRKSSTQNLNPTKRKKKEKRTPAKAPRYFAEEDSFKTQDDVIVINSDEEALSEDLPTPDPTMSRGRWSPSIPLNDSSDEEVDVISFKTVPSAVATLNTEPSTSDVLSTFQPIHGQNTFFLDAAEVSALHTEGDSLHHATVIALRPDETICLLGTYAFTVLQEFTPGGMVALNVVSAPLFGPPFTHPTLPNIAHYIGGTTPRSSPSHYLAAVQAVLETYRLDIQTPACSWQMSDEDTRISDLIPLVVNTMGWNKGLGADLTTKLQDMAEPSDIYEFESPLDLAWPTSASRDAYLVPSSHPAKIHLLKASPISILSTNYSAIDHRSLSIMSYFHAAFPTSPPPADDLPQITAFTWHTSHPLCAQPPFEVGAKLFDKVVLTGAGTEDVVPSEVARVLNGALVALVSCTPGTLDLELTSEAVTSPVPYTQGFAVPSPASSRCLGLALVRSVSLPEPEIQMHVLTPLPHAMLAEGKVLVKGELELPMWGMLDYRGDGDQVAGVDNDKVPFLQWGKGEGVGGEKRRIRRNLMRRGQM
ncbi:hypothetical protein C0991_006692 [Blastosporella zonata]|nr:hypothetical protein C0991_006692 [Blastosporella zonata]